MKKFLAIVLTVGMLLTMCLPASAATYSTTRTFINWLESLDLKYTERGIDSNGYEIITVGNRGEACSYTIIYYFSQDLELCSIRVYNLIEYNAGDFVKVLNACNDMNQGYKFTTWYCDTSDNTVTVSMDLIFRAYQVDEILEEATLRLVNIIDDGYPLFAAYDK